ncbi:MAG: lysophospholipid acyltransferase family protein [Candidatus Omnitrophica bacterium]|nr:lysophospholipid acyltransferase family protein [Candidatus Omnitrophota bacterium]
MSEKERKKVFKRATGLVFLKFFVWLSGLMSISVIYSIGGFLGRLVSFFVSKHTKNAMESLTIAYPEKSIQEKKKIIIDSFVFMGQSAFELLKFSRNPDEFTNICIENKEHLDKALQTGRGVIVVTAHLGNFPLMSLKLAKLGYNVNIVARPMRDPKAEEYLSVLRDKSGMKTIHSYPRKECISSILKALRNNEIVIIQMDQNFGTGGVWVKFYGKLAATPVGAVVFALRSNAVVVPGYIYRTTENGKVVQHIRFEKEEEMISSSDKNETILLNVIKLTGVIEKWIRAVPEQWSWIHKRWKSQPSDEIKKQKYKIEQS